VLALGGASLLIAGAGMVLGAAGSYATSVPRLPWVLFVYGPLGAVLFALGAIVLTRAQHVYDSEQGRTV